MCCSIDGMLIHMEMEDRGGDIWQQLKMEKDEEEDVGVVIKMHMQWQKNLHNCIGYAHGSLSLMCKGKILSLEESRT